MSPAVPKEFIHTYGILPIHQRWDPITQFPPWLHIIWEGRKLIFICEYKLYCHEERKKNNCYLNWTPIFLLFTPFDKTNPPKTTTRSNANCCRLAYPVVHVAARWMDTRFSTHKGFLIQRSYLQEGIRTGCPDAPSNGFVSHCEREEYKSVGLLLGIKELPGESFSSSCEGIYIQLQGYCSSH